jgi:putative polyketide hydroxylase
MLTTTDVLVVGAGPSGLATAISALRHGARVLVVERRAGPSSVPRATGVSIHTMELFRLWGVADAVRAGAIDCEPAVTVTHRLVDEPLEVEPLSRPTIRETLAASPSLPTLVPQDHIEPVLVDEVRRLGGEVRFGSALTSLRITPDGVRASVGALRVRARFVVGADGPRSAVRDALGIRWTRLGTVGDFELALFRSPRLRMRTSALVFVKHPDAEGVLLPMGSGRWGYVRSCDAPTRPWPELLRTATGFPDLAPEILGTARFTMAADVASAYRAGPGFLVGDAAHRMTPFGGVGLNTAVHDGHELGWRLAWAARGLAGDALLDSYAAEREPVGRANAERSLDPERHPADGLPRDLGSTYRSPVIEDDGAPAMVGHQRTARPGERAPHVWFRAGGVRRSTLDLFDGRLTVLTGPDGGWDGHADELIALVRVGHDVPDPRGAIQRAYRLGPESAVLVRPDGIVAWRHDGPARPEALVTAVRTALGRTVPAAVAV